MGAKMVSVSIQAIVSETAKNYEVIYTGFENPLEFAYVWLPKSLVEPAHPGVAWQILGWLKDKIVVNSEGKRLRGVYAINWHKRDVREADIVYGTHSYGYWVRGQRVTLMQSGSETVWMRNDVTVYHILPDFGSYVSDMENNLMMDHDELVRYKDNPGPYLEDLLLDYGQWDAVKGNKADALEAALSGYLRMPYRIGGSLRRALE